MIPQDFDNWKDCIQNKCKIRLTAEFAKQRLAIYNNQELRETQRFIELYGQEHYERIKEWFGKIAIS